MYIVIQLLKNDANFIQTDLILIVITFHPCQNRTMRLLIEAVYLHMYQLIQ
jgi:hypothetical protein